MLGRRFWPVQDNSHVVLRDVAPEVILGLIAWQCYSLRIGPTRVEFRLACLAKALRPWISSESGCAAPNFLSWIAMSLREV